MIRCMIDTRIAGTKRVLNHWIYVGIFLLSGSYGQVWAADVKGLDTGLLAPWEFSGIAKKTVSDQACKINVSVTERDYAGRFFQLFTLTVPGKAGFDRVLELKQITKVKSPSFLISKQYLSFEFEMKEITKTTGGDSPVFKVELVADSKDPTLLKSLRLFKPSKIEATDLLMFDCINLVRKKKIQ